MLTHCRKNHQGVALGPILTIIVLLSLLYIGIAEYSARAFKDQYQQGVASFEQSNMAFIVTRNELSSGVFSSQATLAIQPDPAKFPDHDGEEILIETRASHNLWFDDLTGLSFVRADIFAGTDGTDIKKDRKPLIHYAKGFGDHVFRGESDGFTNTFENDDETITASADSGIVFNGAINMAGTLTMALRVPGITLDSDAFNIRMTMGEMNATIPQTESAFTVGDFVMQMGTLNYEDKAGNGAENSAIQNLRVTSSSTFQNGLHSAEGSFFAENRETLRDPAGDASVKMTYKNIPESFFVTMRTLSENSDVLADDSKKEIVMMEAMHDLHHSGASVSIWPARYTTAAGGAEFGVSIGLNKPADATTTISNLGDLIQALMVQAEMDIDRSLVEDLDKRRSNSADNIHSGFLIAQMDALANEGIIVRDDDRYSGTLALENNRLKINNQDAPEIMGLLLLLAGGGLE